MSQREKIGLGASVALLFGVFCPVLQLPIMGSLSLIQGTSGYFLVAMALFAAAAVGTKRWKLVWVPAVTSSLQVSWIVIEFVRTKNEMKAEMAEVEGSLFEGLAQLAMQSVRLDWGFIVLLLSSVMLLLVAWNRPWRVS